MASLRRPKLCWAPGIKPVACCPSDSLCRHYCTLPLGAPAGAGRGRAGGETETWFREKAAGGGGVRGKSQSKERLACQRCSVPGDPVTHWTPKRWSRCSQKAGREGARARTGTGEPRGRTGSGRRGGLRAGREPRAGRGCREPRAERGGCWHAGRGMRPRTGAAAATGPGQVMVRLQEERGRETGRQASVWGPCQQLRFSGAASRGAEGPTGEKGKPG